MTLLFFDGFETYGSSATMAAGLEDVYDMYDDGSPANISITSSARIAGGQAMRINLSVVSDASVNFGRGPQLPLSALSSQDDWVFGAAFRASGGLGTAGSIRPLFELLDSDSSRIVVLLVNSAGDLIVARLNDVHTQTTLGTASGAFSGTDWNYVEFKVKLSQSVGTFEVRVNESTVLTGGPTNTSQTGAVRPSHLRFGHVRNQPLDIDDLYILDDQGSVNNDFLGNIRVQRLRPNGVGDDTDFSSTGTNWQEVNELSEDDDSTYVQSNTTAERDLYHFEDLPAVPAAIYGIIAKPVLRKAAPGSRTYKLLSKSSGSEADSGTRYPANDYVRQAFVFQTDPATGALWTNDGVNAAQFGLEIVS